MMYADPHGLMPVHQASYVDRLLVGADPTHAALNCTKGIGAQSRLWNLGRSSEFAGVQQFRPATGEFFAGCWPFFEYLIRVLAQHLMHLVRAVRE